MLNLDIKEKITKDLDYVFDMIKKNLEGYRSMGYDISRTKQHVKGVLPTLLRGKAEDLLDTLINYLMTETSSKISDDEYELKLALSAYDHELRQRIKSGSQFSHEAIMFSVDPRLVYGAIASGGTFCVGSVITLLVPSGLITKTLLGLATIALSAMVFSATWKNTTHLAWQKYEEDLSAFLAETKKAIAKWLEEMADAINDEIYKFLNKKRSEK